MCFLGLHRSLLTVLLAPLLALCFLTFYHSTSQQDLQMITVVSGSLLVTPGPDSWSEEHAAGDMNVSL